MDRQRHDTSVRSVTNQSPIVRGRSGRFITVTTTITGPLRGMARETGRQCDRQDSGSVFRLILAKPHRSADVRHLACSTPEWQLTKRHDRPCLTANRRTIRSAASTRNAPYRRAGRHQTRWGRPASIAVACGYRAGQLSTIGQVGPTARRTASMKSPSPSSIPSTPLLRAGRQHAIIDRALVKRSMNSL